LIKNKNTPIRKAVSSLLVLLFPTVLIRPVLNALGHKIEKGASIGFSFVSVDMLTMKAGARIGHLNLISNDSIHMKTKSKIGHLNRIKGPFNIAFARLAAIGNHNKITRAPIGVTHGDCLLALGELAKFTSRHQIDMTKSISLGDFSTVAGSSSQLWTHGYIHDTTGAGRYRLDGGISIGNNVYIGSSCIITADISICDGAIVGTGTTIAKSLTTPDHFVSGSLRVLPRPKAAKDRTDLKRIAAKTLIEPVYEKK